jgi:hypothetical protein
VQQHRHRIVKDVRLRAQLQDIDNRSPVPMGNFKRDLRVVQLLVEHNHI